MQEFPVPRQDAAARARRGSTHHTDFLRACKDGGAAPCSNFDYGGPLTEMVLLGCLAERAGVGKHVEWDAEKVEVTNLPELNRLGVGSWGSCGRQSGALAKIRPQPACGLSIY